MNRDNQQETANEWEIGWVAGIIEGEGSIVMQVSKRKYRNRQQLRITPRVIIANTDKGIIGKYIDVLEKLNIGKYVRVERPNFRNKNSKRLANGYLPITYVNVEGVKRVMSLLTAIEPYMSGDKKLRANTLLKFFHHRIERSKFFASKNNIHYDEKDIENILAFLKLTKTKNYEHVSRILNEYTQGKHYKKRLKMYSELMGNHKSQPEMVDRQI